MGQLTIEMSNGICAMRDFLLVTLSFSASNLILNVLSEDENTISYLSACPYLQWYSFLFTLSVLGCSLTGLVAYARNWSNCSRVTWAVDCVGVLPGLFWIATTKPYGWYAAVNVPGCSVKETPISIVFWIIGEWLTWGSIVRLCVSADFGKNILNTLIVLFYTLFLSALSYVMSGWLRWAYNVES